MTIKRSLLRRVARRLFEVTGLRVPDTGVDVDYPSWVAQIEPDSASLRRLAEESLGNGPKICIVMPVYNPRLDHLTEAVESVRAQVYPNWQLCICNDASSDAETLAVLDELAKSDLRIRVSHRSENGGIGLASAGAAALADGDFLAMLDQDDVLPPWALYFVAKAVDRHPGVNLLYSDEDKLDANGVRFAPHFKPDFNPDLLLSLNYVGHLLVIRRSIFDSIGGFRPGFDGAQDYDLILRCVAVSAHEQIVHIPAVLYHWRAHSGSTASDPAQKRYAHDAGVAALTDHLSAGRCQSVADGPFPTSYRVLNRLKTPEPLVSVVIPTRDGGAHLRACLRSLTMRSTYARMEIVVLDNQSRDPETLKLLDRMKRMAKVQVLRYDRPFNYSAINNFGVRHAQGDVLVLLNDDVVVRSQDWLETMLGVLQGPGVGVVGAKLYYPDGRVQHGGVVLGIGGVAGHSHKYFSRRHSGYFGRLVLPQTVAAVTGACLAVRRSTYEALGGLDEENLPVAFNDIDFCLRVGESGLRCVWTPYAELTHHESASRGAEDTAAKRRRFQHEAAYMKRRWGSLLREDPNYSPFLTRRREDFSLREDPPSYLSLLQRGAS